MCHKREPISDNYSGLVHEKICCDKMNGSLMVYGVLDLLKSKQTEAIQSYKSELIKEIEKIVGLQRSLIMEKEGKSIDEWSDIGKVSLYYLHIVEEHIITLINNK